MNVLVTGAKGFIGRNLIATLNNIRTGKDKAFGIMEDIVIYEYDMGTIPELLDIYCKDCDFIFHLAGVNRPKEESEFMEGNFDFTSVLLDKLKIYNNKCPIMISSSIQAQLDNPYGRSKKAGENLIFSYGKSTGAPVYVYRFSNVFGKWCRPNYNSAIATFCNNIAHDLPIQINDRNVVMSLIYIDDVVAELIAALQGQPHIDEAGYCFVPVTYTASLGSLVDLIYSFRNSREELSIPDMTEGGLIKKLYATYLNYLPTDKFSYPLKMNLDQRGSFTEIIRTPDRGQFSVNIFKPGITKGNHWHNTKNEKFVVVSGSGVVKFRKVDDDSVIEYPVTGDRIEVVDIPTGYTHNISNVGNTDLVVFMWCNECFNLEHPDTYYLDVIEGEKKDKV